MLIVNSRIQIPEEELHEEFTHASGPGGQNVNKVSTAVQLRFDAANSPSLPDDVRRRLLKLAGSRATKAGEILIDARNHRTRERNREEARERLVELLRRANRRPTPRKKTKPGRAAKERRIQEKKQRGRTKESRKPVRTGE